MIILRRNNFSRIQDEDYRDELEKNKKSVKHAKRNGTIKGALGGAATGLLIGANVGGSKAALLSLAGGTLAGGGLGYHLGKKKKKEVEEYADKMLRRYESADEKDKAYLRKRLSEDKYQELQRIQANAQRSQAQSQSIMALNSWK